MFAMVRTEIMAEKLWSGQPTLYSTIFALKNMFTAFAGVCVGENPVKFSPLFLDSLLNSTSFDTNFILICSTMKKLRKKGQNMVRLYKKITLAMFFEHLIRIFHVIISPSQIWLDHKSRHNVSNTHYDEKIK